MLLARNFLLLICFNPCFGVIDQLYDTRDHEVMTENSVFDRFPISALNNESSYGQYISYYDARFSEIFYTLIRSGPTKWLFNKKIILPIMFVLGTIIKCWQDIGDPQKSKKAMKKKIESSNIKELVINISNDASFADRMISNRISNFLWRNIQSFLYPIYPNFKTSITTAYLFRNFDLFFKVLLKRILYHFIKDNNLYTPARHGSNSHHISTFKDYLKTLLKEYTESIPIKVLIPTIFTILALIVKHFLIQIGFSYMKFGSRSRWFISLMNEGISPSISTISYTILGKRIIDNAFICITSLFFCKRSISSIAAFVVTIAFVINRLIAEIVKFHILFGKSENSIHISFYEKISNIFSYMLLYFVYHWVSINYLNMILKHKYFFSFWIVIIIFSYFLRCMKIVTISIILTIWKFSMGDFYNIFNLFIKAWHKLFIIEASKPSTCLAITVLGEPFIYLLLETASIVKEYMINDTSRFTCSDYEKFPVLDTSLKSNNQSCSFKKDNNKHLNKGYFAILFDRNIDKRWFDISLADILFYYIFETPILYNLFRSHLVLPSIYFAVYIYQNCHVNILHRYISLNNSVQWNIIQTLVILALGYMLQHIIIQSVLYYDIEHHTKRACIHHDFPSSGLAKRLFNTLIPIDELLINMVSIKFVDIIFGNAPKTFLSRILWLIEYYSSRRASRWLLYQIYPSSQFWRFNVIIILTIIMFLKITKNIHRIIHSFRGSTFIIILAIVYLITIINDSWNMTVESMTKSLWNFFSMDIKYSAIVTLVSERHRFIPLFLNKIYFPFPDAIDGLTLLLIKIFDLSTMDSIYQHYTNKSE